MRRAKKFNEHFVSMQQKIAYTFSASNDDFMQNLPTRGANDLKFRAVTCEEVEALIDTLKKKNSSCDRISNGVAQASQEHHKCKPRSRKSP